MKDSQRFETLPVSREKLELLEYLLAEEGLTHPGVQEAIVLAREDSPGENRLVGYAISRTETSPTTQELRRFLQSKLPDYMVPSAFVFLDRLPMQQMAQLLQKEGPSTSWSLLVPMQASGSRPPFFIEWVTGDHLQIIREPQVQAVAARFNQYLCQAQNLCPII